MTRPVPQPARPADRLAWASDLLNRLHQNHLAREAERTQPAPQAREEQDRQKSA